MEKTKIKKEKTRAWYKKNWADVWFSRYIRLRGKGQCYTCKNFNADPMKLQCGHFVPRQYSSTRYDETNCQSQCYACNMLYNGQPDVFALNLTRDFGNDIVKQLNSLRSRIEKDMNYEGIGNTYKKKFEMLFNEENEL